MNLRVNNSINKALFKTLFKALNKFILLILFSFFSCSALSHHFSSPLTNVFHSIYYGLINSGDVSSLLHASNSSGINKQSLPPKSNITKQQTSLLEKSKLAQYQNNLVHKRNYQLTHRDNQAKVTTVFNLSYNFNYSLNVIYSRYLERAFHQQKSVFNDIKPLKKILYFFQSKLHNNPLHRLITL